MSVVRELVASQESHGRQLHSEVGHMVRWVIRADSGPTTGPPEKPGARPARGGRCEEQQEERLLWSCVASQPVLFR